jgi:hypothetical protein
MGDGSTRQRRLPTSPPNSQSFHDIERLPRTRRRTVGVGALDALNTRVGDRQRCVRLSAIGYRLSAIHSSLRRE